jgi:hypothetical protein
VRIAFVTTPEATGRRYGEAELVMGEQVTVMVCESAQPGVASPSEAARVIVTGPGCVHLNVGVADVALLSTPEGADQA